MILLANMLTGIAAILHVLLKMLTFIVVINALLSWVNPDPMNPIVRFLNDVTRPLLRPIRRHIPLVGPGIDISPIVLILGLLFIDYALVQTLADYASAIKRSVLFGS